MEMIDQGTRQRSSVDQKAFKADENNVVHDRQLYSDSELFFVTVAWQQISQSTPVATYRYSNGREMRASCNFKMIHDYLFFEYLFSVIIQNLSAQI